MLLDAGAGVDSVWEQKKLEARKMLVNRAESRQSTARFVGCGFERVRLCLQSYLSLHSETTICQFFVGRITVTSLSYLPCHIKPTLYSPDSIILCEVE